MSKEKYTLLYCTAKNLTKLQDIEENIYGPFGLSIKQLDKLRCAQNTSCVVCQNNTGQIVGFMFYNDINKGYKIVRILVDPLSQGMGVGSFLIEHIKGKLSKQRTNIKVILPDNNLVSHLFFANEGFIAKRVISGEDYDEYEFEYNCTTQSI